MKFCVNGLVVCALFVESAVACAQTLPGENVSVIRHTYLAAAQRSIDDAYASIVRAQDSKGHKLGGHAERAKELLQQANEELKAAAITANSEGRY
ncbi:hypothetical protein [Burkholderia sp. Bp8986]|uniref:hypothetical protein n=1 Tax=Burkholderia sp. Bp8986 TaxID=2184550 RepID=UPI000F59D5FF|nr:hypothetical protein [Burkholderia sp. Bp8986]RQS43770.1 hypothetical protein DID99_34960 [Burkholderia sp. Bp8986]